MWFGLQVNFHAEKDYEYFANFKIFQAALVAAELPKAMNVQVIPLWHYCLQRSELV